MCCYRLLLALIVSLYLVGAASAADPLGRYPVDPTQISVAGISSGAFMANQLHVAHSADIMGVGVVAGGPFGCAVADTNDTGVVALISIATGACMQAPNLLHPAETYAERIRVFAAQGWIDPIENLTRARLYAFTGQSDQVVNSKSVRRGVAVYAALGLQAALFRDDDLPDPGAGHSWVTQSFGGDCELNTDPYINKCNYDQAKDILSTIYGPLKDKATQLSGHIVEFDQHQFVGDGDMKSNGLWDTGYLYVPAACEAASGHCRLHVVLHGCRQSAQKLHDTFYRHIGVNEWADTNDIIVLYPQARAVEVRDFKNPQPSDIFNINPEGCWNWWGYAYDSRYLFKDGIQLGAIWAMVQRVTGRGN
jgi:poly(3-hydroxybutyrate) depolymerase